MSVERFEEPGSGSGQGSPPLAAFSLALKVYKQIFGMIEHEKEGVRARSNAPLACCNCLFVVVPIAAILNLLARFRRGSLAMSNPPK